MSKCETLHRGVRDIVKTFPLWHEITLLFSSSSFCQVSRISPFTNAIYFKVFVVNFGFRHIIVFHMKFWIVLYLKLTILWALV